MDQAGFLFFSRIFTYGDIPLETHLETIDEYLDKFDSLEMDTSVPREKRFESASLDCFNCRIDYIRKYYI